MTAKLTSFLVHLLCPSLFVCLHGNKDWQNLFSCQELDKRGKPVTSVTFEEYTKHKIQAGKLLVEC